MDKYFILSGGSGFLRRTYHVMAPEPTRQEDFESLVRKSMKDAAKILLEDHRFYGKFISWSDIMDEVVHFLVSYGYTLLNPKKCEFKFKGELTRSYPQNDVLGEVLEDVLDHNDVTSWGCYAQAVS